jgi:hypothetical protein
MAEKSLIHFNFQAQHSPGKLPGMSAKHIPPPIAALPKRHVDLIVIHCSATQSGKAVYAPHLDLGHKQRGFARNPAAVRAFNPGLPHIGYHFVIAVDGRVQTGRHVDEIGAHAKQFNLASIGICMIGGIEKTAAYSVAQWEALAELVQELAAHYKIPLKSPVRHMSSAISYTETDGVCGHRDLSPDGNGNGMVEAFEWLKTCPGFDVSQWLKNGLWPADKAHILGAAA